MADQPVTFFQIGMVIAVFALAFGLLWSVFNRPVITGIIFLVALVYITGGANEYLPAQYQMPHIDPPNRYK